MRWRQDDGSLIHLSYCTNVHPAESLSEVLRGLREITLPLKGRLCPEQPFAVGLYLSARAVDQLLERSGAVDDLGAFLADNGLYVPSLNAFPYGGFHAERVKEGAFHPAWDDPARVEYTCACARILAALLPEGVRGAISTHTGGLASWGSGPAKIAAIRGGFLAAAEAIERVAGPGRIGLALEPEPFSTFESVAACARFLRDEIPREAVGLCLDACHAAVLYEDAQAVRTALLECGCAVHKVQISSALEIAHPGREAEALAHLREFIEPRWFHQVCARLPGGELRRAADLVDLLAGPPDEAWLSASSWRVHFHVPVFAGRIGTLGTTRGDLEDLLRCALAGGWSRIYEIETYTFDKLPPEALGGIAPGDLVSCLEREYRWVFEFFERCGLARA